MRRKFIVRVLAALLIAGFAGVGKASAVSNNGVISGDSWTTSLNISIRNNGNSYASSQTYVSIGGYALKREGYTASTSVTYRVNGVIFQTVSGSGSRSWPFASVTANAQTGDRAPVPAGTVLSATSTHSYTKASTTNSLSGLSVSTTT